MPKPKPSEWGKLSHGQLYIFWSIDFARAVFSLGLGENVGMLFWYVVENSWGSIRAKQRGTWPDPVAVEIRISELAESWGVTKQRVYDAEQWLLNARMVVRNDAGYWVNKNADEWVHPRSGNRLLDGKRLAYALGGRTRSNASDSQTPSNVATLPSGEYESERVTLQRDESNVTTLPYNCQSNVVTLPASIGTPAELDSLRLDLDRSLAAAPRASASELVPISEEHRECVELARELFAEKGAEAAALVASKGLDILDSIRGPKAESEAQKFACYAAALRQARQRADGGTRIRNLHTFTLRLAAEYARVGIPPGPVAVEPAGAGQAAAQSRAEKIEAFKRAVLAKEAAR